MDLLTSTELGDLAGRDEAHPTVSLFIGTHRYGSGTSKDPTRWKNLLAATAEALEDRGLGHRGISELLSPARGLLEDAITWQYMSDGLAFFLAPGWHHSHRVPFGVPEVATIGARPAISPLLRATSRGDHFLILTVSQRHIRLLEATRDTAEEVELRDDVPRNLLDAIEPPDPRSDTMARSLAGGSSGPAVFYGHGAADDDFKSEETARFFRQVASGLHEYLVGQHVPMVLVGLERATAMFREMSTYPHLTAQDAHTNPDPLDLEQVHAAAWPLVAEQFRSAREALGDRFQALHGTGQASADPRQILTAAEQGRVETLFVATDPWIWQSPGAGEPLVVDLDASREGTAGEFVRFERTAVATLQTGGEIYTMAAPTVPGGGRIAATFRY